ncbi:hypothetical protein SAMN05446635_0232 [Burkholderia sp. OK233]|nr:hypothetical protein SAMN05446635_0232 [Burkholderia sp. OK233]
MENCVTGRVEPSNLQAYMFKNPFVIEHRRVGAQAKEYALSLALTETDKDIIVILGLERHVFVAERHLFLAGVLRSAFGYFDRQTGKKEIRLALMSFDQNLDEYFSAIPGLSPTQKATMDMKIRQTYQVTPDPLQLFGKFLTEVTAGKYGPGDLPNIPGFAQAMEQYMNDAIRFLHGKIVKLD